MTLLEHSTSQLELLAPIDSSPTAYELPKIDQVAICGKRISTTPVFAAYWYFACERQNIFFKRIQNPNARQLTTDPVLSIHKFTNAYRASDRVSQYLIKNVIYRDDLPTSAEEVFFRIMLFKLFNKVETWEALENAAGEITLDNYSYDAFSAVLNERMANGIRNYSAAYIMPSAGRVFGQKLKHQNHLLLLEKMIEDRFPDRLRQFDRMEHAYELLLSAPSIGPFLAYQYVTDINYSEVTDFSEREFVVAGPGALDGIAKCFGDLNGITPQDVIKFMCDNQDHYFDQLGYNFQSLWGRPLQLIDCQNLFCEISKYSRAAFPNVAGISGRTRIKQKHVAGRTLPTPWYPPKWGINAVIDR